ncbi:hypothetical protein M3Y96_00559400 [Aphelenchoides besseyi]|nr:hypothetical protein M3Y96_00559400 [Aphelenchoides besseyi]
MTGQAAESIGLRQVKEPHIYYGNNEGYFYIPHRLKNAYCVTVGPVPPLLNPKEQIDETCESMLEKFQVVMQQRFCQKGMGLPPGFTHFRVSKEDRSAVEAIFVAAKEDKRCELVFILSNGFDSYHGWIKKMEQKYDVVTVHITFATVMRMFEFEKPSHSQTPDDAHSFDEYFMEEDDVDEDDPEAALKAPNRFVRSVVRKINAKLGGLNYRVVCNKDSNRSFGGRELYVGINLEFYAIKPEQINGGRCSLGDTIAVLGYAANDTFESSAFTGNYKYANKGPKQILNAIMGILRDVVSRFREERRNDPTAVYVFTSVYNIQKFYALRSSENWELRRYVRDTLQVNAPTHFVSVERSLDCIEMVDGKPDVGTVLSFESINPSIYELSMISHLVKVQKTKRRAARKVSYRFYMQTKRNKDDQEETPRQQPKKTGANFIPVGRLDLDVKDENQNVPRGFGLNRNKLILASHAAIIEDQCEAAEKPKAVSGLMFGGKSVGAAKPVNEKCKFTESYYSHVRFPASDSTTEQKSVQPTRKFGTRPFGGARKFISKKVDGDGDSESTQSEDGKPRRTPVNFKIQMDGCEWDNIECLPWKMLALSHCHQLVNKGTRLPSPVFVSSEMAKRGHMMLRQSLNDTKLLEGDENQVSDNLHKLTYSDKNLRETRFNA